MTFHITGPKKSVCIYFLKRTGLKIEFNFEASLKRNKTLYHYSTTLEYVAVISFLLFLKKPLIVWRTATVNKIHWNGDKP